MRACRGLRLAVLLVCVLALGAGCVFIKPPPKPGEAAPAATPETTKVRSGQGLEVTAFLDATSPCEKRTREFLALLTKAYGPRVEIETVNYRDEAEGSKRWMDAKLKSSAILLDGTPYVSFERGGAKVPVGFVLTAGYVWNYQDLADAVAAGVAGKLEKVDEDATVAARPTLPTLKPEVSTRLTGKGPDGPAVLIIEGQEVLALHRPYRNVTPEQRLSGAIRDLLRIVEDPFSPEMLLREETTGGEWVVVANGRAVLNATPEDAQAAGTSPAELSRQWLHGIRDGLALAAVPKGDFPKLPGLDEGKPVPERPSR
jgi:hypothetical protein